MELGTRKFVGIFNQPWPFLNMMFLDTWQNHYLNIVSLFGKTSLAVSDWVFRRKPYFTQLDKFYILGRDSPQRERESWSQKDAWRKNRQFMLHIFINILQFLIFVDKSWFSARNLFIYLSIHVYFKVRLPANECYESSKFR